MYSKLPSNLLLLTRFETIAAFCLHDCFQELGDLKAAYQKGEDPVADQDENVDLNTVAGLLKLYFRELEEKLFPESLFDDFIACAREY